MFETLSRLNPHRVAHRFALKRLLRGLRQQQRCRRLRRWAFSNIGSRVEGLVRGGRRALLRTSTFMSGSPGWKPQPTTSRDLHPFQVQVVLVELDPRERLGEARAQHRQGLRNPDRFCFVSEIEI